MRNSPGSKKPNKNEIIDVLRNIVAKATGIVAHQDAVIRFYAEGGSDGGAKAKDLLKKMGV